MTTLGLLKIAFMVTLILIGSYAIFREKDLIRFERKVKKYVKAFFKALYLTAVEKKNKSSVASRTSNVQKIQYNEEYEQMLASLNKASKLDDVLVA